MGIHKKERQFEEFARQHVKKSTCIMLVIFALMIGAFAGNVVTSLMFEQKRGASATTGPSMPATGVNSQQAQLEAAAAAAPEDPHAWSDLGNYYFDHDMPSRAIAAYEKSLALGPDHANVWSDLGVMYRRTGQFEKAIEAFERASAVDPKHITARFNKGVVLLHDLKQKDKALAAWQEILHIDPEAKAPNGQPVADLINETRSK